MTCEAMTSEDIPFIHSGKSLIFKMHEVLWSDELERIGIEVKFLSSVVVAVAPDGALPQFRAGY